MPPIFRSGALKLGAVKVQKLSSPSASSNDLGPSSRSSPEPADESQTDDTEESPSKEDFESTSLQSVTTSQELLVKPLTEPNQTVGTSSPAPDVTEEEPSSSAVASDNLMDFLNSESSLSQEKAVQRLTVADSSSGVILDGLTSIACADNVPGQDEVHYEPEGILEDPTTQIEAEDIVQHNE